MIRKKLKSNSGETIAEVLIASLIVVLGVLLYSTMVDTSFRIVTTAETKVLEYYKADNAAELKAEPLIQNENISISGLENNGLSVDSLVKSGDTNDLRVNLYGNFDITSYRRARS